jgi:NhaP-type Na+/H+ or K+/H+ antiporter
VFFSIFAERYFYEMNLGVGADVGLAEGIALFFQKSLGAVAVGLFFSLGLLFILYIFKRRLYREERVVEVSATFAIAYLSYYVADAVWKTSGVISTLTLGVTVRFFGRAMINDPKLLDDFWVLVEHILNTVLFTLGGVVWGATIMKGEKERTFTAKDWGYMILLYVFETLIRTFLFAVLYPVTSRIGLKTNWSETIFQIHGGLRGAVGIALAIYLDNEVREATEGDETHNEYKEQARKVVALVGGLAFLTLTINGPTAGPLLRKLGLTDETEAREKIVHAFKTRFKANAIDVRVNSLLFAFALPIDFHF